MNKTQRNLALGTLAVVLLAYSGYRIFGQRRGVGALNIPEQITQHGVCLACKQEVEVTHPLRERPPYVCPVCGERAVYIWWYCYECHYRFIPTLEKDDQGVLRPTRFPRCPHCGCTTVGEYNPEMGRQTPEADYPLPKWP